MQSVPAIIQARMSSARLPGKMLRQVRGKAILQYVIERVRHCDAIGEIIVATSTDATDAAIVEFCRTAGVRCVRGPVNDVAARFQAVLDNSGFDCFARICGDRALLDPALLARGIELYGPDVDVVTNVQPRTFPPGQTVEIVRTAAFADACLHMEDAEDREHVTRYFYRHPAGYRIVNFGADTRFENVHLAIDTEADFDRFAAIVERMDRPHWCYGLSEIVDLYRGPA